MASDQDHRFLWSDGDVCIVTSRSAATVSDVDDLGRTVASWTCPEGRCFTGPVRRLDTDSYVGVVDDRDLMVWSAASQTCSIRYSSSAPIRTFDLHAQYVALLGDCARLELVCRSSFRALSHHQLHERTITMSISADATEIALIQARPDRQIQFFDIGANQYRPDAISLRRAPVAVQYRSPTQLMIVQKEAISIWSIPYRACLWLLPVSPATEVVYVDRLHAIAALQADGVHFTSIASLSSGLSSVLGSGRRTRALSGQVAPYMATPDPLSTYLVAVQNRPVHAVIDADKHKAQILRCLTARTFDLFVDLVRCAPEHTPKSLLTELARVGRPDLVAALLPVVLVADDEVVALLGVVRSDPDLLRAVVSLPKTDAVVVRHLSGLPGHQVADLFASLTRLMKADQEGGGGDLQSVVSWLSLLVDAQPVTFIHNERCRALLRKWEPSIEAMAQASFMAEKLVGLLVSFRRQHGLAQSNRSIPQNSHNVETIIW